MRRAIEAVWILTLLFGVAELRAGELGPAQTDEPSAGAALEAEAGEIESGPFGRHRVAIFTGYGIVPSGGENEERIGTVVVPTLAFDYGYWLNRRFALGWYNDLALSTFVVETGRSAVRIP